MQSRHQGGSQDNSYDFLWGIALTFALIFVIWHFGRTFIASGLFQAKDYEIIAIQYVLNNWNMLMDKLHIPMLAVQGDDLKAWQQVIQKGTEKAQYSLMVQVLTDVGKYLRYPVGFILIILAYIIYSKSIFLRFKTTFSLKSMKMIEQSNYPQITPVSNLNLIKKDIDKGPWAMAMTPMQFCKAHHLLKEKTGDNGRPAVDLIKSTAYQVFVMQLGPLWKGPQMLPIYMRALFAVFAASANHDRDAAFSLIKQINISANTDGKLNFEGVDKLLVKYYNSKVVTKVVQKHAYVLTVLASMLELARTDGVFASSEFLWLKPVDRRLWYMLNTVGRQTAVSEVAGPYAHWMAERKWGAGLRTPMLDEAVKGMEIALSEIIYEPDEK